MASRGKNWTKEEMDVLKSAVNAHPDNPHAEFASVSQIVKKSRAAVNAKYARMYGPQRVMRKNRLAKEPEHKTEDPELPKVTPKKKLNAFQRFVKRLFNI